MLDELTPVTLDEAIVRIRQTLEKNAETFRKGQASNPEDWPDKMLMGDWFEQLLLI